MFRTVADQVSLWEAVLPAELLRLPEELARVDELLDDEALFGPFEEFFDPRIGRPSTPMEVYLRLMFLKFRYRLGYETLCREVSDSFTWRRFCRIPFDGAVPHPTTLMKLTTPSQRQADPGGRRRGPHQGAGSVQVGRNEGARHRGEAAVPRAGGPRRGQGRRAEDHRGVGRTGPVGDQGRPETAGQRPPRGQPGPHQG